MSVVEISAWIDRPLKEAIERYCKSRGLVMNRFVQEGLLDKLEEGDDIEGLQTIRREPTRLFSEVIAELGPDEPALARDPGAR